MEILSSPLFGICNAEPQIKRVCNPAVVSNRS